MKLAFSSFSSLLLLTASLALATACDPDEPPGEDAGEPPDAGMDAGTDAGTDAGHDAGFDAGIDAETPIIPLPPEPVGTDLEDARLSSLALSGEDVVLGYTTPNAVEMIPRLIVDIDAETGVDTDSAREVFDTVMSQSGRQPALATVSGNVLAMAWSEDRGCEGRVLDGPVAVLSTELCRGLVTADAPLMVLGRRDDKRIAQIQVDGDALTLVEGARGVFGSSNSNTFEVLDGTTVMMVLGEGTDPLQAGVLDWQTGDWTPNTVASPGIEVSSLRLVRDGDGWVLLWLQSADETDWEIAWVELDAAGAAVGTPQTVTDGIDEVSEWAVLDTAAGIAMFYVRAGDVHSALLDRSTSSLEGEQTIVTRDTVRRLLAVGGGDRVLIAFTHLVDDMEQIEARWVGVLEMMEP